MTGERDHRVKPDRDAVHAENVINKNLLKRADILHGLLILDAVR